MTQPTNETQLSFNDLDTGENHEPNNPGSVADPEQTSLFDGPERVIAVDLGSRALRLLETLKDYSKASSAAGRAVYADTHGGSIEDYNSAMDSHNFHRRNGNHEFYKAYGLDVMALPGTQAYGPTRDQAEIQSDKFYDEYTGSDNAKKRERLRRILDKQLRNTEKQ